VNNGGKIAKEQDKVDVCYLKIRSDS